MSYKSELLSANAKLAEDPARIFVGYGLTRGRAAGTIPTTARVLETPVAENLMVGAALGLALAGQKPVVYFERFDFILNALDAIVNHLDKAPTLSRGEFSPAVILRITVGNKEKPLFTGAPHTQDFTDALRLMVRFPVFALLYEESIASTYALAAQAQANGTSCALIEYKDLW